MQAAVVVVPEQPQELVGVVEVVAADFKAV
jgi:hypothetical protein